MNKVQSVLGVIACAGYGSRVSRYVPQGTGKECVIAPNGKPVIFQHLDMMTHLKHLKGVLITINKHKISTIGTVLDWTIGQDEFKDPNLPELKSINLKRLRSLRERILSLNFKADGYSSTPTSLVLGDVFKAKYPITILIMPDEYIVENPLTTLRSAIDCSMDIRNCSTNLVKNEDVDVFLTLPDIYYTNPESVFAQLRSESFDYRNPKACAIDPRIFESVDIDRTGRSILNSEDPNIIDSMQSVLVKDPDMTEHYRAETGIMYCSAESLFNGKDGDWVYDCMNRSRLLDPINNVVCNPIHAITIESDIVDFGNPETYEALADHSDDVSISDHADAHEDDPELEVENV